MEKTLVCTVEMFSNSTLTFRDGTRMIVPNEVITEILLSQCKEYNYDTIHFFGNEDYLNGMIENFKILEQTKYGSNDRINIEVN